MRFRGIAAVAALALATAPSAQAQKPPCHGLGHPAASADERPAGFKLRAREAIAIARRTSAGRSASGTPSATDNCGLWEVNFVGGRRVQAEVLIDGRTGEVLKAYSGYKAEWARARGSRQLFVGPWTAPIVAALALLSLAVFFDRRRPRRATHLDMLLLVGTAASLVPYGFGEIWLSTPLATAALALLVLRLVAVARRPDRPAERLAPWLKPAWLLAGAAMLLAGRGLYAALVGQVSDVGYLSVFGAQAFLEGFPVYALTALDLGAYGPATHMAYVPFTAVFPLPGGVLRGGDEAARAASITFDVLTAVVLYAIGRRLREGDPGRVLGATFAFAWAASPLAFYQVANSTNDGLVGLFVALGILGLASPAGRGAAVGLAGAAKWVPFVLVPLFAAGTGRLQRERVLIFTLGFVAAIGAVTLPVMPDGGPREIYDVSLGGLAEVDSPFGVWGLWGLPDAMQTAALAAVCAFAVAVAFVPRRRPPIVVAGLAAAVIAASQIPLGYWSHSYVSWFLPCAIVGLLARPAGRGGQAAEGSSSPAEAGLVGERVAREISSGVTFRG